MMRVNCGNFWTVFVIFIAVFGLSSCKSKKIISDANVGDKALKQRYARLLDVSEGDIKNEKLYRFIDQWMGVPYRYAGMDRRGVDCSGFVVILEKEIFNKGVPRVSRQMAASVKRKFEEDLQEGDLVFFNFNGQVFGHVGIYLQNNRFVHASSSKGVTISNLKDPWFYKYFSRAGSVSGDMLYSNVND